ncbi:DUF4396 domain-containing protein [Candidatus Nomurabacteria bacterium]|nr:DUF4396 domain-containing protein [Candidatus Nomurabacteria bacterium]
MKINKLAFQATLHCLIGCSIGEVAGMMIGAHYGLDNVLTIIIAVSLAFVSGYSLSLLPLVRSGMRLKDSMKLVLAADTLSIAVMEIVDNLAMYLIPGAMDASLNDGLFWLSMGIALLAAFLAAYPVNAYLLSRGRGHALTHNHHGHYH